MGDPGEPGNAAQRLRNMRMSRGMGADDESPPPSNIVELEARLTPATGKGDCYWGVFEKDTGKIVLTMCRNEREAKMFAFVPQIANTLQSAVEKFSEGFKGTSFEEKAAAIDTLLFTLDRIVAEIHHPR